MQDQIKQTRYSKRLYSQMMDYKETFSTTDITSVRALMQMAAQYDLDLQEMHVKTAYLHAPIGCEIYIEQPEGFVKQSIWHWLQPHRKACILYSWTTREIRSCVFMCSAIIMVYSIVHYESKHGRVLTFAIGVPSHCSRHVYVTCLSWNSNTKKRVPVQQNAE